MATAAVSNIEQLLGTKAESLLGFKNPKIAKERLHLPGPDFIDRIYAHTDRNLRVLANLQRITASSTRCYPLFFSCTAPLKLQRFCGDDDVAR